MSTTITDERVRVIPDHIVYTDEGHTHFTVEVNLTGVDKEDISFSMRDDSFYLTATTGERIFSLAHSVCHPVDPHQSKATFRNGTLSVDIPFKKPLKPLVDVPIREG